MPTFDPPKAFEPRGGIVLHSVKGDASSPSEPMTPVALSGTLVISYDPETQQLTAVDVMKEDQAWVLDSPVEAAPPQGKSNPGPGLPPVVSEDGKTVYAAYSVRTPDSGTTKGGERGVAVAVDIATGKAKWTADLGAQGIGGGVRQLVGDRVVVWNRSTSEGAHTWILDASTGKTVLDRDGGITAANDAIGTVVDVEFEGRFGRVVSLTDGKTLATVGDDVGKFEVIGSTDAGVLTTTNDWGSGEEDRGFLLDPKAGTVRKELPGVTSPSEIQGANAECTTTPGKAVAMCLGSGARGYDLATGRVVWDLFTKDRIAPSHVTQFHGQVYAVVDNNGSPSGVVIDGQTGKDIASGGLPVEVVNEHGGILRAEGSGAFYFANA
ncbi:hypothetical protein N803_05830 [Knoellia subterranea KCTC 19937]|uniref:Uncharacterized protein n=1 Tax=Knoellia subterranea KCTC 19937 TaxID=1385521 RepID=A0A0A0JJU0_9MICO|nr:hypothetical protein N803_05830 [Knoellia subterranea KCTC 19937]